MSVLDRYLPGSLYGPARRLLTPRMAGRSDRPHIALTFDDGPDLRSTPEILETLARHGIRATFFLIGEHLRSAGGLVGEMSAAGHEIAVHGWTHRCVVSRPGEDLTVDLRRASDLLESLTGGAPRWYRPPFGIATRASGRAARSSGLETILWTAWGRDWSAWVGPAGIDWRVRRTLRPGGTVLLHDTDRYAATGSWTRTNAALRRMLPRWLDAGCAVGPLGEHWGSAAAR